MKKILSLFFTFSGIYSGLITPCDAMPVASNGQYTRASAGKCLSDSSSPDKPAMKLYPNPARNKIEVSVKGFDPGFVQLQFFDSRGNKLRDDRRMLYSGNELLVVMFSLSPGLYFVVLKQRGKTGRTKLNVQ